MKIYDGSVVTCDAKGSVARFLVEDGGKIVFVGDSLPQNYNGASIEKLGDKALLPALSDTHIHFMSYALFSAGLDVRKAQSIAETRSAISDFIQQRAPVFVLGFGASAHSVKEKRLLNRDDIDSVCSDRPAFIVKYDGHAGIANSALIKEVSPVAGALRGFSADTGLMTQEAFFKVTDIVSGKVSLPATLGNMLSAIDTLAGYGVGLVHSVTGVGFPGDMDVSLEALFARGLANPLAYRIFFQTMDTVKAQKRKLPRIGGCFKTALDGCFGTVDAALVEPYLASAGLPVEQAKGVLYYSDEKVAAFCKEANRKGLQIELHAIGSAAFEQAVYAIGAALDDFPREDHRHTIIHACLTTPKSLELCAKHKIRISAQPGFLYWEQEPFEYIESIIGKQVYDFSPLRTMVDMGIELSGGSDAPCTVPNPIDGIWAACNHYVPEQSLTIQESLNLYTRNAAAGAFDEKERGSLEVGKLANMVLMNRNPLSMNPADLRSLVVERLLLEGKPYVNGQGRLDLLFKGLVNGGKHV